MKTINLTQLQEMIEPGRKHPVLINTLPRGDFQREHIPGSINIPAEELPKLAGNLVSKHDWIVVYCAGRKCTASKTAAETLEKLGFQNVYRFEGGLEEWRGQKKYTSMEKAA